MAPPNVDITLTRIGRSQFPTAPWLLWTSRLEVAGRLCYHSRQSSHPELGNVSTGQDIEAAITAKTAITGRSCGACSLCCKLLPIRELEKPENQWCVHCRPGNGGCGIYAERPASCRGFACDWLVNPHLGDEWVPTRAKMFVHYNYDPLGTMGLYVVVDPARPDSWRREPYFSQLKGRALHQLRTGKMRLYVTVGRQSFLILPDAAVETTDKFHLVVPVGPDRWEARCFATREEAMAASARLKASRMAAFSGTP